MKKLFVVLLILIIGLLIGGCQSLVEIFTFSNKEPIIISEPIITATENNLYSYEVKAIDPEGNALKYFLSIYPEGMSISSENGLISWSPNNSQVGIHQVEVEVSDGRKSVPQSFEIEVFNTNNPPKILSYFPANLNVNINEGDSIKFEIEAEDVDFNTTLNYRWYLNGLLVSNSSVNPVSGSSFVNNWTYFAGVGNCGKKTLKAIISDGTLSDSVQWEVTVNDVIPPNKPTLNAVTSPTNMSSQILSGTKEPNSSIWINGTEAININSSTDWSCSYGLSEGDNSISITSRDVSGNESVSIIANIVLDSIPPETPTLNDVTSPTNISPQVLSGTKEASSSIWVNGVEVIPINPNNTWSYSFDLSEGINNVSITSRDSLGNESFVVTETIKYDLNTYVDAKNTSGTENGSEAYPFDTIVEGIEAAVSGKSVMVAAGTYNEQLVINKGITLQGESRNNTFITGTGFNGNSITIAADNVTISGFNINGKSQTDIGIFSDLSSSIEISGNIIQSHRDSGIFYHRTSSDYPSGIYVYNNEICYNLLNGIKVTGAGSGIIESNIIRNSDCGIFAYDDTSLEVKMNNIYDNFDSGIFCRDNSSLLIWENEIKDNGYGIKIGAFISDTTNPDIGGGARGGVGKNNIAGNTSNGISNKTDHNIYAENNWWGDAAGPKYPGNSSSSGDWIYWSETGGNIIFNPYLKAEP